MESETTLVPTSPVVHLVAKNPTEMQSAQVHLAEWLRNKLKEVEAEITDLNAALHEARTYKWDIRTLTTQRNRAVQNEEFYCKLLDAVEAGYTIIPDFPLEIFAIRVDREGPNEGRVYSTWQRPQPNDEQPDVRPTGEGEYVSPVPKGYRHDAEVTVGEGKKEKRHYMTPTGFRDVLFPLRACRPEVMSTTAQAMALKVFDQLGICPPKRKPDPLIIGQVLGPLVSGSRKCVSFIIAWHLNLKEL